MEESSVSISFSQPIDSGFGFPKDLLIVKHVIILREEISFQVVEEGAMVIMRRVLDTCILAKILFILRKMLTKTVLFQRLLSFWKRMMAWTRRDGGSKHFLAIPLNSG